MRNERLLNVSNKRRRTRLPGNAIIKPEIAAACKLIAGMAWRPESDLPELFLEVERKREQ